MIPKIIHYCWFGYAEKSPMILACIDSWKKNLTDYEIIEWNESNFNINSNPFVKQAYEAKKWAFVSDYARVFALFNFGGIYLDTDMEIKQNLDVFLIHRAFGGFETKNIVLSAIWATEAGHSWPQKVLNYYDQLTELITDPNTFYISNLLHTEFGLDIRSDSIQQLREGICIYPSSYFCMDLEPNFATHHFDGSWLQTQHSYKQKVNRDYALDQFLKFDDGDLLYYLYKKNKITKKGVLLLFIKLFKLKYLKFLKK